MERRYRVAVVDDEPGVREIVRLAFTIFGLKESSFFESGEEFLKHYEVCQDSPPAIVLMDMSMPGLGGAPTLERALRLATLSETLFLAHSAYTDPDDSRWLGFLGFDGHVQKPASPDELIKVMDDLVAEREVLIRRRDPYGKILEAVRDLSKLRIETSVLAQDIRSLISPQVYSRLKKEGTHSLKPTSKTVAVAFADLRGFTMLANTMADQQIGVLLELYFDHCCKIIETNGGFVDKFIGDAIMWLHEDNDGAGATACIKSGVEILQGMKDLNKAVCDRLHLKVKISAGIGAAYGDCSVGLFGARKRRIQYSAIGRPVNLASRLCSEARGNELVIGGEIIEHCKDYTTRRLGYREVKGFSYPLEMRRVVLPKAKKTKKSTERARQNLPI